MGILVSRRGRSEAVLSGSESLEVTSSSVEGAMGAAVVALFFITPSSSPSPGWRHGFSLSRWTSFSSLKARRALAHLRRVINLCTYLLT